MDEKVMLKRNQLQRNSFKNLRSQEDFLDVTLVSTDQVQLHAHKVILSATSEFFSAILSQNKHSHPIVCLDGVSSRHLEHLLDYIYHGEINIFQNEVDAFLLLTNRFKLDCQFLDRAKTEPSSNDPYDLNNDFMTEVAKVDDTDNDNQEIQRNLEPQDLSNTEVGDHFQGNVPDKNFEKEENIVHRVRGTPGRKCKDASFIDANIVEKIKSQFKEIMQIGKLGGKRCFQCSICHKAIPHTLRRHAMSHVERHIEGLVFSCKFCDKKFHLSDSLRMHMKRSHNKKV